MKLKKHLTQPLIQCELCGKNLLSHPKSGNFVLLISKRKTPQSPVYYEAGYYCCKGDCGRKMRDASFKLPTVESDIWEDISEFTDPLGFLKIILRWGRRFREGRNMSPEAADKFDDLLMAGYLDLVRDLTEEESARVKNWLDQGDLL